MALQKLTAGQTSKIVQALAETERHLAKALRHSPDLREDNMIAFYERHIARLNAALVSGEFDFAHRDSAGPLRFS